MNKLKKSATQKYHFDALKALVSDFLKHHSDKYYSARQILRAVNASNDFSELDQVLTRLVKTRQIHERKGGQYKYGPLDKPGRSAADTKRPSGAIEGRLEVIRSGAAYLISDQSAEDIYIHEKNLNGAIHGDIVKVSFVQNARRKPDGKVIEIVRRETHFFVGTLSRRKTICVVQPDSPNHRFEIHISNGDSMNAKEGDKVIVHILSWRDGTHRYPKGKVTQILDKGSIIDNEMTAILINHGFPIDFSHEAQQEAQKVSGSMKDGLSWPDRKDFRNTTTFTIDPETARDFDDALSVAFMPDGNLEIGVHIADASHYLSEGSILDQEAYARSTSVYLVDRASPMLPEILSGDICSLKPLTDRLTFSVVFTFDHHKTKVLQTWIGKSVIHSNHRFTYEAAQDVLDLKQGYYLKELGELNRLAKLLRTERFKAGSIGFDSPEYKFQLDPVSGRPLALTEKVRIDTHLLVEEFMLLANKAVAEYIFKKEKNQDSIPFVYRVHDLPDLDKLKDLASFSKEIGYDLKINTPKEIAKSLNALYEASQTNDALKLLQPLAIRTMAKAEYTTNNIGHYGLAFELYSHFTSPIRRYSDILAHRILFLNMHQTFRVDKKRLEEQCKHISNQERKAMDAERESVKFFQLLFIMDHVGEEFDGVISGIIEKGVFVELDENHVEGFIPFVEMAQPFYLSDNRLKALGRSTGFVLSMGDKIKIKIQAADMTLKRVQMSFISKT